MGRNVIRILQSGAVLGLLAASSLATPISSLAADVDASTAGVAADGLQSASSAMPAATEHFAPAGCGAITRCVVARTGEGLEMYSGGDSIYLDRFAEDD